MILSNYLSEIISLLKEVGLTDNPMADKEKYLQGMRKGKDDKLFFLHHIRPDLVVDFGSADGYILSQIRDDYPHIGLIGYDISPDMIQLSSESHPKIKFTNRWNQIQTEISKYKNPTLLLSSVIHEVYSYSVQAGIDKFWKVMFNSGFKYIVIRDTIPSINLNKIKNFRKDVDSVKQIVDKELLADYESRWGSIDKDYKNFIRFVLMYRYKENWSRERLEDYLPINYEDLTNKIDSSTYKILYNKQFKFKPIQTSFAKDFKIPLRKNTHLKMILKKG